MTRKTARGPLGAPGRPLEAARAVPMGQQEHREGQTCSGKGHAVDRRLGRPRNAVVLPVGWYLTASAIRGTVTQLSDGRIRLDFWNARPDSVDVLLKARRRVSPADQVH